MDTSIKKFKTMILNNLIKDACESCYLKHFNNNDVLKNFLFLFMT